MECEHRSSKVHSDVTNGIFSQKNRKIENPHNYAEVLAIQRINKLRFNSENGLDSMS